MRTTVDLDEEVLAAARERAAKRRTTLSRIIQDAVRAYLEAAVEQSEEPFELITAGSPGGRYPAPGELSELLAAEDIEGLVDLDGLEPAPRDYRLPVKVNFRDDAAGLRVRVTGQSRDIVAVRIYSRKLEEESSGS